MYAKTAELLPRGCSAKAQGRVGEEQAPATPERWWAAKLDARAIEVALSASDESRLTTPLLAQNGEHWRYREYAPHPALAPYVQCCWTMQVDESSPQPIIGRGLCKSHTDLIFAAGGAFCAPAEHFLGETSDVRCYVVGPMLDAAFTHSTRGVSVVGLRLRPSHAHWLLKISAHELTRSPAPLRELWPDVSSSRIEQVAEAAAPVERMKLLERMTLARSERRGTIDPRVDEALRLISETRGQISVDGLLSKLDIGARQLERRFRERVGLSPKKLCQIARIQFALELLRGSARPNWVRIAFECGFYDQAHFIRHFKAVTGIAPSAYLTEGTLKLSER